MPSVKACSLDPADLVTRFRSAAQSRGFREEPLGECDGVPLFAFTRRAVGAHPKIYLSSGVHGDEPAPPEALLSMLTAGIFDDRATWFLVPMLNPSGFRAGTRENLAGLDLNRDYFCSHSLEIELHVRWLLRQPRFDLAICLHEDWESTGFYLYELARKMERTVAQSMREAAADHLPIEAAEVIDGRPRDEPGIIRPESDPALRETWPEAIYLFKHHTDVCYTLESPSALPWDARLHALTAASVAAIKAIS